MIKFDIKTILTLDNDNIASVNEEYAILKAYSFFNKKSNQYITYIPKLAYLFNSNNENYNNKYIVLDRKTYNDIQEYYKEYIINYKTANSSKKITHINLTPTGYCQARCSYCYASDYYNIKDYITPEIFQKTLDLNKDIIDLKTITLYGGEPVLNFNKFKEFCNYLINDFKIEEINVITSLFYSDELFNQFLVYLNEPIVKNKINLNISIEPSYIKEYQQRKYKNINDIYTFIKERVIKIINTIKPNYIKFAFTLNKLNNNIDIFRFEDDIYNETGFDKYFADYELVDGKIPEISFLNDNDIFSIINQFENRINKYIDTYDYDYLLNNRIFNFNYYLQRLNNMKHFDLLNILKLCGIGRDTIAMSYDGGIVSCTDFIPTNNPKKLNLMLDFKKEYDYNFANNKDKFDLSLRTIYYFTDYCNNVCQFTYSCGSMCFVNVKDYFNNNLCKFYTYIFLRALHYYLENTDINIINEKLKNQWITLTN